jgi:arginine exporter protein ArgO
VVTSQGNISFSTFLSFSPVLFGMLTDGLGGGPNGLRTSVIFLWGVLLLSVIFYFFAALTARSKALREERDAERLINKQVAVKVVVQ